jgi:Cdc6-like AAA superfamily ATPase
LGQKIFAFVFSLKPTPLTKSTSFSGPIAEIEYLERLLQLEQAEDLADYQRQVLETPLKERQKKGSTWYPVRLVHTRIGTGGKFVLELERNPEFNQPHQFQSGVQAALFWNAPAGQKTPQLAGTVISVDQQKMELQVQADDLPDWIDERLIGVDLLFDENSYREMKSALQQVREAKPGSRLEQIRDTLLGWRQGEMASATLPDLPALQHLNSSQKTAIQQMLGAKDVFAIHGPPGTGKTTTLVAAVQAALPAVKQVLVCAPSNAAADLLTEKLAAAGIRVLRIGNPARISEEILPYTMDYLIASHIEAKEIKRLRKLAWELKRMAYSYKKYYDRSEREQKQAMLKEAREILKQIANMESYVLDGAREKTQAFVATLVGASHNWLRNKTFPLVLIDEAGQALEPASWIPVLKAQKLVLAGDHCQLPPTVKSKEASRLGLDKTLLEKWAERGDPSLKAMLEVQYRMHTDIMEFSSGQFYQNRLQAHDSVAQAQVWPGDDAGNEPLVFLDTAGTGFEEKFHPESTGLSNPGEAGLLIRHLQQWLESHREQKARIRKEYQVSVISPYREQVERLKKDLQPLEKAFAGQYRFRCGTVDGFQGQEADVVYISLVRSNDRHEIGFLRDIRRMNVALTRARKRLVVVGDSATLAGHGFYDALLGHLDRKARYCSAWEVPEN